MDKDEKALKIAEAICDKVEVFLGELPFYTAKNLEQLIKDFRDARAEK